MPGLDILRGIAVLAVFTYHGLHWWLPPAATISTPVKRLSWLASPGWLGVNLFFVLSGFLITGILLDTRDRPHYWKSFYTRRALRILPIYVVVLVILRLYGLSWIYLLFCLFYLANFTGMLHTFGYGPLWSLAVEEQFYLVWPFLVRRLTPRALSIVCIGSILLSPALRYLSVSGIVHLGDPYTTTWLLTDNLAVGALISIVLRTRVVTSGQLRAGIVGTGVAGMALLAIGVRMHLLSRATAGGAAFQAEPFLLLFAALLLLSLRYGSHPMVLSLSRPLRFYGYISYGLYLFHVLAFGAFQLLLIDGHPVPAELTLRPVLVRFFVVLLVTTTFCYLSRRYFEEFFLRLKDRLVPYASSAKRS